MAHYVTFKQAKKLKEDGFTLFNKETKQASISNRDIENQYYSFYHDATNWGKESNDSFFDNRRIVTFMEKIGTNSSKINTLLASYRLLGDIKNLDGIEAYLAPEHWQVIDWLKEKYGIWVQVKPDCYGENWYSELNVCAEKTWGDLERRHKIISARHNYHNEQKSSYSAYSAAFDYILENLI